MARGVAQNLCIAPLRGVDSARFFGRVDLQKKAEIHNPLWFWRGCTTIGGFVPSKLIFRACEGAERLSGRACSILDVDHNAIKARLALGRKAG
jgi:hypothetical protein